MYCLRLLLLSLFLFLTSATADDLDESVLNDVHRILQKRSILDNVALDGPRAQCRNGGIYAGGICHCIKGQTGDHCEHFECVKGLSVGFRFDPESLLFNEPCICESGWKGEMCDYQPAEKCGNKGEWKKDRCECVGSYFGSECQYTSRCIEGFLRNGRCICNDGFEGDYCDKIICVYGSPDFKNRTLACNCPDKFAGRRCEQCKKHGPLIEPFPHCELDPSKKKHIEKAAEHRAKVKKGIRRRIQIICICVVALSVVAIFVCVGRCMHKNAITAKNLRNREDTAERHRLLTNHVRLQKFEETVAQETTDDNEAARIEERNRRKSEPAVLKLNVKKEKIKLETKSPVVFCLINLLPSQNVVITRSSLFWKHAQFRECSSVDYHIFSVIFNLGNFWFTVMVSEMRISFWISPSNFFQGLRCFGDTLNSFFNSIFNLGDTRSFTFLFVIESIGVSSTSSIVELTTRIGSCGIVPDKTIVTKTINYVKYQKMSVSLTRKILDPEQHNSRFFQRLNQHDDDEQKLNGRMEHHDDGCGRTLV